MLAIDRVLSRLSGLGTAPAGAAPPAIASRGSYPSDLDTPLLLLSPHDAFTLRDACAGVHVFGANGSGKTSGSGRALAKAYLTSGFGGLVLCAKPDEAALWRRYGKETGRLSEMIFISPDEPWRFNFIEYELRRSGDLARPGDQTRQVENLLKVLSSLVEQAGRNSGLGEAQFWQSAAELLLRNALMVLAAARPLFTLADLQAFIDTAPRSDEESRSAGFASSICGRDLEAARSVFEVSGRGADFAVADNYWRVQFARLPDRTRGSIVMTLGTLLQDLQTGTVRELFATRTNVFPEDTHEGAVIVIDLPAYASNANLIAQTLFKTVWQQAAIRRAEHGAEKSRPIFLWADEAQFFATARDTDFLSIARSARVANVYMTQNLAAYQQRLGTQGSDHAAQALMGYFQTKVFHALSDPPTLTYAQQLFGKTVRGRRGVNGGESDSYTRSEGRDGGTSFHSSSSMRDYSSGYGTSSSQSRSRSWQSGSSHGWSLQEQLEDAIFANDFTGLSGGGAARGYRVEAFIFAAGRLWSNGTSCLPVVFDQRL